MPIHRPPRREPRVIAIARTRTRLSFVTVDPWEVRSSGSLPLGRSLRHALVRLFRLEKPTAFTISGAFLRRAITKIREVTVPLVAAPTELPEASVAADLYPELVLMATRPTHRRLARLAIAVVLAGDIPPRTYAHRRNHPLHDHA